METFFNLRMENFRGKMSDKKLSDAFSGLWDKKAFGQTTSKNMHDIKIFYHEYKLAVGTS